MRGGMQLLTLFCPCKLIENSREQLILNPGVGFVVNHVANGEFPYPVVK